VTLSGIKMFMLLDNLHLKSQSQLIIHANE